MRKVLVNLSSRYCFSASSVEMFFCKIKRVVLIVLYTCETRAFNFSISLTVTEDNTSRVFEKRSLREPTSSSIGDGFT